jgi:hypothetical protein
MIRITVISGFILFIMPIAILAQPSPDQLSRVEDVCLAYPEKIRAMLQSMDLSKPGLERVSMAFGKGELVEASRYLLDYYRQSGSAGFFERELPVGSNRSTPEADSIVGDIYTFQRVAGKVPRLADGRLDWFHNGPENDIEWAWALNRHYIVRTLLDTWYETGNQAMLQYIDRFINDWITSSWPYPAVKSSTAMWRGLEVSFRVKIWARVFFELIRTDFISPATRLLILASLPEHAHYARNFHAQNNWLTMEISGLATAAAYWPEYRESSDWLEYTTSTMINSMKDQVYPDGVQTELTSSYHLVALDNFMQYQAICDRAGIPLPEYYTRTIDTMWSYLALTMRPDGYGILNNDADLLSNRSRILALKNLDQHAEWEYIATNGQRGRKPAAGPSFFFPWAGHLISRNGYDADAHWSFFDIGPWGSGHQHNDKLHLSVSAYGRDLLVDGGRFAYRGAVAEKFRRYATGSASHNLLMFNGKGQSPGPRLADSPVSEIQYRIEHGFDYASGSFDTFLDTSGHHQHNRAVMYIRGHCWIVVDQTKSAGTPRIEALWHWHPDSEVKAGRKAVAFSTNTRGNLMIIPVGNQQWRVDLVKGQEEPEIQGWYSPVYNVYKPNTTAIYSRQGTGADTFIWVLIPYESEMPVVKIRIISMDEDSVRVRMKIKGRGSLEAIIPMKNSEAAQLIAGTLTR